MLVTSMLSLTPGKPDAEAFQRRAVESLEGALEKRADLSKR